MLNKPKFSARNYASYSSKKGDDSVENPYLVVITNNITDEVLDQIDNGMDKKCIIFSIHGTYDYQSLSPTRNHLKITASMDKWNIFAKNITHLKFEACIADCSFTTKHLRALKKLHLLDIGATNYPLFKDENIDDLPIIKELEMTGYGLVEYSDSLNKWMEILKENNCEFILYRS